MQPKEKIVLMHRISQIDDIIRRGTYLSASQIAKEVVVSLPFLKYNMQNIQLTRDKFEIQKDFNAKDYVDKTMGVWLSAKTNYKERLLFNAEIGTFTTENIWHEW